MGQLLSALFTGSRTVEEIFLDFDNCRPSEAEMDLWTQINEVLKRGPAILQKLFVYKGCDELIRRAINDPNPENDEAAWNAVLPHVDELQEFYEFAQQLEQNFPKLLVALCSDDPRQSLNNQQALAKQLGDLLDFVLRFDDAKMVNPAIQNDFSFYRRSLSRMKMAKKEVNIRVRDDLANRMSLFFATPTPMMQLLTQTTVRFLTAPGSQNSADYSQEEVTRDKVTNALAQMANICQSMVETKKFANNDTNMFCLRTMTGAIILYDHVHESGAFCKKSPVNMKGSIQALRGYTQTPTDGLLNALRFTTLHLHDADTPSSTKQLLA